MSHAKKSYYFTGGLAQLVSNPSPLTYSYLKNWFTGSKWVGEAMSLLHLPFEKISLPILEMVDDELVVNLIHEEKTLYQKTLFSYKAQESANDIPALDFNLKKLLCFSCVVNTLKIILVQSMWIAKPEETADEMKKNIEEFSNPLDGAIWGLVIATGFLSEFYNQFLLKEVGENMTKIYPYVDNIVKEKDWFFKSYADQEKVKKGDMPFSEYMDLYGLRGDRDYELACPRWWEIRHVIQKRINEAVIHKSQRHQPVPLEKKIKKYVNTFAYLQLLRSDAKQKALVYINNLRQDLLKKFPEKFQTETVKKNVTISSNLKRGKGRGVSQGIIMGTVQIIHNVDEIILPGSICIFPDASPEFAIQFPKCKGMIFLKGGTTSHGAIVAREYGIPAIIDDQASGIPLGVKLTIDGAMGNWSIV